MNLWKRIIKVLCFFSSIYLIFVIFSSAYALGLFALLGIPQQGPMLFSKLIQLFDPIGQWVIFASSVLLLPVFFVGEMWPPLGGFVEDNFGWFMRFYFMLIGIVTFVLFLVFVAFKIYSLSLG